MDGRPDEDIGSVIKRFGNDVARLSGEIQVPVGRGGDPLVIAVDPPPSLGGRVDLVPLVAVDIRGENRILTFEEARDISGLLGVAIVLLVIVARDEEQLGQAVDGRVDGIIDRLGLGRRHILTVIHPFAAPNLSEIVRGLCGKDDLSAHDHLFRNRRGDGVRIDRVEDLVEHIAGRREMHEGGVADRIRTRAVDIRIVVQRRIERDELREPEIEVLLVGNVFGYLNIEDMLDGAEGGYLEFVFHPYAGDELPDSGFGHVHDPVDRRRGGIGTVELVDAVRNLVQEYTTGF